MMNGMEMNLEAPTGNRVAGRNGISAVPTAAHKQPDRQENEFYIRTKTCAILRQLGIPVHLAGHLYLVEAVALAVTEPDRLRRITTMLYPAIARRYSTTPAAVERAMRHAIETAWYQCEPETFAHYFGNAVSSRGGRPNNSELIARVSNLVREGAMS